VEHVAQLRDDRDRFEEVGANVVLIGLGRPDQAGWFCDLQEVPFACMVQPDRSAHKAYGLRRGSFTQVSGPAVWAPWVKNQLTGKRQRAWRGQGDTAQLPGTFVVDTSGMVRYAHRGARSNDVPPNRDVLEVLAHLLQEKEAG
jgi:peroxiredoxin